MGAALAKGEVNDCAGGADPAGVDGAIVAAVQRILKSPGSGVDIDEVVEIRIFKATASGGETAGAVNVWRYTGEGTGPEVDPGPGILNIDFSPITEPWPACLRVNNGAGVESLGVKVIYRYRMVTPISSLLELLGGSQAATITLAETTIMALNPTVWGRAHATSSCACLLRPDPRPRRGQRGQVLPIFAIMSVVLLGAAALVTDVAWMWTNQQRMQRAADAGALAGAIHLPGDQAMAFSTALAETTKNGFTDGVDGINITPRRDPGDPRKLLVDIEGPVGTFFARVFCFDGSTCLTSADVEVTGAASYVLPVPMGSPQNYYGVGYLVDAVVTTSTERVTADSGWQAPATSRQRVPGRTRTAPSPTTPRTRPRRRTATGRSGATSGSCERHRRTRTRRSPGSRSG